ncbi:MAG: hypothetical protein ACOC9O_01155 [Myxococcota bacterium]
MHRLSTDRVTLPTSCDPALVFDENRLWIRAWTAVEVRAQSHPAIGAPNYSIKITGKLPEQRRTRQAVVRALRGGPLNLDTDLLNDHSVIGSAQMGRPSDITRGREWGSVRVDVHRSRWKRVIEITVSVTFMVSSQNSDDPRDYHPPTEAQQQIYNAKTLALLRRHLSRVCSGAWTSDHSLRCR